MRSILLALGLGACAAPTDASPDPPDTPAASCVSVTGAEAVRADAQGRATLSLWVSNGCAGEDRLRAAFLGGDAAFTLEAVDVGPLPDGQGREIVVAFQGRRPGTARATLFVDTDGEPVTTELRATWDVASFDVDIAPRSTWALGCPVDVPAAVVNGGTATGLLGDVTVEGDPAVRLVEPLLDRPVEVPADGAVQLTLRFAPQVPGPHTVTLGLTASAGLVADPREVVLDATPPTWVTDRRTWHGRVPADVVFVVDRRDGELTDASRRLARAVPDLLDRLDARDVDARVLAIVDDGGCPLGGTDFIVPATPTDDAVATFEEHLDLDGRLDGSDYHTGGFEAASAVFDPGNLRPDRCTQRWRRADADLHLVFVSRHDDGPQDTPWEPEVDDLQTAHGPDGRVLVDALAGSYPSGCVLDGQSAVPGVRYYLASRATDGLFQSICAPAGPALEALGDHVADEADQTGRTLTLTNDPFPATLEVRVGDRLLAADQWRRDGQVLTLDDDVALTAGDAITARYVPRPACP